VRFIRIASTNWIHLLGFYITTYLYGLFAKLIGFEDTYDDWFVTIFYNLIGIIFLLLTYGLMIVISFYLVILCLDLLLFQFKKLRLLHIVIMEWAIIIPPFIYWAFAEDYWLWLALIGSLLTTQLLRRKVLMKKYPQLLP